MNRKLVTVVSAMMLGLHLGSAVAGEPSLDQLAEIESILSSNDVAALRSFLNLNPELLEGETQLAILLRRFLEESNDLTSFLAYAPDLRDAVIATPPATEEPPVDEGSDPGDGPDGGGNDPGGEPLY
ncbi:MAG: hypothetical protein H0T41_04195 [Rhodobacteraceae bacterium]|nr:hypothetical protein [Paracoccaceae bacterium]